VFVFRWVYLSAGIGVVDKELETIYINDDCTHKESSSKKRYSNSVHVGYGLSDEFLVYYYIDSVNSFSDSKGVGTSIFLDMNNHLKLEIGNNTLTSSGERYKGLSGSELSIGYGYLIPDEHFSIEMMYSSINYKSLDNSYNLFGQTFNSSTNYKSTVLKLLVRVNLY
jgi:hypothetical protein